MFESMRCKDGNQRRIFMSILLWEGVPVVLKWRKTENAKVFIRNISGLLSMIEMCSMNGTFDFLRFQSKTLYLLYIT